MNVAIVGAGAVGRLVALSLTEARKNITVFDRQPLDKPDNAAFVSAGMLCPLGEIIHAPRAVLDMGLWSLERWPSVLRTLKQQDPEQADVFYQTNGSLAVAFPQDASCFKQLEQDLRFKAADYENSIEWLDQQALNEIEPSLRQFTQAAYLKTEGQLCNRGFLNASTRALQKHAHVIDEMDIMQQDIEQLAKDYDWVIDCRGSGAIEQVGPQLSDNSLRGVRGEVLRVYCPDVTLSRPVRVMHPRNSIYIVPKPNHEFVVGATEIETHAEHPVTLRSCLELMSTLYAIHPAFSEAQVLETRVGIRTAFADNIPKIQRSENIISANGLYRHGWLIGPAIAHNIVQTVNGSEHELRH